MKKLKINKLLIAAALFCLITPYANNAFAEDGFFLDLDIGVAMKRDNGVLYSLECNREGSCTDTPLLGSENPYGIVRIGFEKRNFHAYFQHVSSIPDVNDVGIDLFMIGYRFR